MGESSRAEVVQRVENLVKVGTPMIYSYDEDDDDDDDGDDGGDDDYDDNDGDDGDDDDDDDHIW